MTAKFQTNSEHKPLSIDYRPLEIEKEIRTFWEKNHTLEKLMEFREKNNIGVSGWVEGPPTLNGIPHIGHARGRIMKDLRFRWKTMQGYFMPFWAGWDCQGLPVELEVEKLLGVRNKRELLERVGEERFIEECKKTIMRYHREWVEADRKLGIFIDQKKAYWTYLDNYIEREWQYLKRAWEQGLLEEGYYVVAYCPGCQTSLSSAEVGYEGSYVEVEDPSLYFKFKVANSQDEYFLVWTTMPFTVITDLMLAIHPEAEYAKVKVDKEKWIMVRQRVEPVMQELGIEKYEIVETIVGKSLEGLKYEYPFKDLIPKQAELDKHPLVHRVVCEEFVDVNTATGVVHLSPGNGEEDFAAAQKRGVPVFAPFDDEVKFTDDAGFFSGVFARDADAMVVEELRKKGLLANVKTIRHEYPTCWRSHHKLVWLARREYFLRTDCINEKVLKAAEKVEYYFEAPKNRFLSFLKEGKPWCISRERVWGAPLPIWTCEKCGTKTLIASKKELVEKAIEKPPQDFELHKPWIDRIKIQCEKCRGIMHREPFVLDTWHNSGASPYARFTDEEFAKYVPVDFLTEGIDQTRGWANSLLLEHVILTGKAEAPYKAFLFQGLTQDAKGRKMSKSLGNIIEVNKLLEKASADVCRFYLLRKCSPIEFMNFDVDEMNRRPYQVLATLYHLNRFFVQNAEYDGFNPKSHTLEWAKENRYLKKPDLWLLSKLQKAISDYTARLNSCEFNFALAELEEFVVEVVSRLYVPMIRKELWTDEPETLNRRLAIYACLWHVLKNAVLLFNPVTPFLSEVLYQKIYRRLDPTLPESVNFEKWPEPDEKLRDKTLEEEFEILLECVSLAYSARQSARLKRRWPLRKMLAIAPLKTCKALESLKEILLELANVKEVEYAQELPENLKAEVDAGRWVGASEKGISVYLDAYRDEGLLGEGLMRDIARRVQSLRKELGYVPTDMLDSVHIAGLDEENMRLLQPYLGEMAELVRAKKVQLHTSLDEVETEWYEYPLDEKKIHIAIS
ncbi:MAG: isoleucine--tRNA ligase [Candidatus Bathyarchaeota archaeon]|nr:isoleucine--tRNA ligase [Candidatus Bathyarchaeota archaeon A05DMB-3]MDH7607531.1 isoleucine--tRNA ligase [Candidatus Bathyarchaeota archaeon]